MLPCFHELIAGAGADGGALRLEFFLQPDGLGNREDRRVCPAPPATQDRRSALDHVGEYQKGVEVKLATASAKLGRKWRSRWLLGDKESATLRIVDTRDVQVYAAPI